MPAPVRTFRTGADGIQEVSGSIPLISTMTNPWKPSVSKDFFALRGNRAQHMGKLLTTFDHK
jgi:hypothetical protein